MFHREVPFGRFDKKMIVVVHKAVTTEGTEHAKRISEAKNKVKHYRDRADPKMFSLTGC
jgi:hypothetical protein